MNKDKNSSCIQKGNCRKVSVVPKVFCRSQSVVVVGAGGGATDKNCLQQNLPRLEEGTIFSFSFYTLKNWQQKPGFNKFFVLQFFLRSKKQKAFHTSFLWLKIIIMWWNQMSKKRIKLSIIMLKLKPEKVLLIDA